jgi:hypothetical protein
MKRQNREDRVERLLDIARPRALQQRPDRGENGTHLLIAAIELELAPVGADAQPRVLVDLLERHNRLADAAHKRIRVGGDRLDRVHALGAGGRGRGGRLERGGRPRALDRRKADERSDSRNHNNRRKESGKRFGIRRVLLQQRPEFARLLHGGVE